jgi:Stress responsive A/B Barrel Domain
MITHMVLLKVRRDVSRAKIEAVFGEIGALQKRIAGIRSYAWGPYSSPEGLHRGYTHGFCMTFTDAAARDAYLPHPEHEQVKAHVLEILDGGVSGVLAFDFESK